MGIFDKLKGGKKDKVFEDELMDTQSELIALTLNMVGKAADKIFAYCSIEAKSQMFNVFFELDGKIKTLNEMGIQEAKRLGEYVHQRDPSWNWGKPVKPGILNEYHQGIDRKA